MEKKKFGVGAILQSKKGGYYIKVEKDVVLKEGDLLFLEKPVDRFTSLRDNGKMQEDKADALIERHRDGDLAFIKFFVKDPFNGNG